MRNKTLITIALVLTLTACTDMGSSQQEISTEFEGYGSSYPVTIEEESLSEPAVPLIEYQESEDTIDLTNIGKTEYFPQSKVGDVIGGQTIESITLTDTFVNILFSGETTVEVYYVYSEPEDGPLFGMVLLSGTSLELPDLTEDFLPMKTMDVGLSEIPEMARDHLDGISWKIPEDSYPLYYCKANVDNIVLTFRREIMGNRYGEGVNVLDFRFEQFISIEEVYALYE